MNERQDIKSCILKFKVAAYNFNGGLVTKDGVATHA